MINRTSFRFGGWPPSDGDGHSNHSAFRELARGHTNPNATLATFLHDDATAALRGSTNVAVKRPALVPALGAAAGLAVLVQHPLKRNARVLLVWRLGEVQYDVNFGKLRDDVVTKNLGGIAL